VGDDVSFWGIMQDIYTICVLVYSENYPMSTKSDKLFIAIESCCTRFPSIIPVRTDSILAQMMSRCGHVLLLKLSKPVHSPAVQQSHQEAGPQKIRCSCLHFDFR
jgi:hypothetical protein